jgi:hypothetical protein
MTALAPRALAALLLLTVSVPSPPPQGGQARASSVLRIGLVGEARADPAVGPAAVLGVLKSIYDMARGVKDFYDEHLSTELSEEAQREQRIIQEINEQSIREILSQAWGAIRLFTLATSVKPTHPQYRDLLREQLVEVASVGVVAHEALLMEIRDTNRRPEYAARFAEAFNLLVPVLAATGRELGWDRERIVRLYQDAIEADVMLLGPTRPNHPNEPIYDRWNGKLDKARGSADRTLTDAELERIRVVVWNGNEQAKRAKGITQRYALRIWTDVHSGDTHRYRQCLTRIAGWVGATDCVLQQTIDQAWQIEPTDQGYVRVRFLNLCMAPFSGSFPRPPFHSDVDVEPCSDTAPRQVWEWVGSGLMTTKTTGYAKRQFLYVLPDGRLTLREEDLPYVPEGFPHFSLWDQDVAADNRTYFLGNKSRRVIGKPVVPYESKTFSCPNDYAVQGVIAAGGAMLSNFGLICAPTRRDARGRPTMQQQLAEARVISFGTTSVNGYVTAEQGDDFWTYYNRAASGTLPGAPKLRHEYFMCPVGTFVNSIKVHFSPADYVFGLESVRCVQRTASPLDLALPRGKFGTLLPAAERWQWKMEAMCPVRESIYIGMTVYRTLGWATGGFEGACGLR